MLKAAVRAIEQLSDPAIFRVLILSILGSAAVFGLLWFGIGETLAHARLFEAHWLDWLARFALGAGTIILTFFLFSVVAVLIASLFLGSVAAAVERRWYPGLPTPRNQPLGEAVGLALSFAAATLLWNLAALPFYLLIPGGNAVIFLVVNGYLLGREYFELVAQRRIDRKTIVMLRRTYPFRLLSGGMVIAAVSFVPVANLVTPIVATAFMIHVLYGMPEFQGGLPSQAVR